ncbi:MAG: EFR1 family ferrodoxin [Bacteroidaceae bacterium]|nr:EFR1 family ferrodoxin [Bacteroidaceae bacterium]
MFYCFSGTGNSQWVADKLQGLLQDEADVFGMVFPVYAWGVPKVVKEYLHTHMEDIKASKYVWAVITCGDDIGYADTILNNLLGRQVDAVFSVHMPNTYVCLPGFDTDPADKAKAKVQATQNRLPSIADSINKREKRTDVCRGAMPWIKTYVLRPLFNRFLVTDRYFHTNSHCIHCQHCVRSCPLGNITISPDNSIRWKHENCTGCLRCYHQCPCHSIHFGIFTKNKGQHHL